MQVEKFSLVSDDVWDILKTVLDREVHILQNLTNSILIGV